MYPRHLAGPLKAYLHRGEIPRIAFFRDAAGHEVDLIVDTATGSVPIEIKSGETIAADFFRGLQWWRTHIGQRDGPAILLHGGKESYVREGVTVLPWWAV